MSERTFRAVVAAVLVGALLLGVVVALTVLPRPTESVPSPVPQPAESMSAEPSAAGPVLAASIVASLGPIPRGASSGRTLTLQFLETSAESIPNEPGSFLVILRDRAGAGATVSFEGSATIVGPDSLGATAVLVAPNVLQVSIAGADRFHVELLTLRGLGIKASSTAAVGAITATMAGFEGSLGAGAAGDGPLTVGSVVDSPPG